MPASKSISTILIISCLGTSFYSQAADWSDTEVSILKGSKYHDNGNGSDIKKTIVTLQHASGYKYGRNFFFVDSLKSDRTDHHYGEIYGEYYHTLSYSKIAKADWSENFIKDVGLSGGINYGAKNSPYGSNPTVYLLGTTFDLKIPGFNFFHLNFFAYNDNSTHSGFGGGKNCGQVATTYQVTPTWNLPFSIGNAKFSFEGFMDIIGKHGSCEQQILTQPQLRWDIGNYFGQAGTVFIGIEYQYWKNKYGLKNHDDNMPQAMFTWKL
jgi:nucleoside-specific outer membrane channel protein Tsx